MIPDHKDGPSNTLLEVIRSSGGKAPNDWKGYRELTEKWFVLYIIFDYYFTRYLIYSEFSDENNSPYWYTVIVDVIYI